jgi:C1A family cysteine protease
MNYKEQVPLNLEVDLRPWDSPIKNQMHLGSCEGEAITGAYEVMLKKYSPENFTILSPLFVYYNTRLLEEMECCDVGAILEDGMISLKKHGVCSESLWPYNPEKFNVKPTQEAYDDGLKRKILTYEYLDTITDTLNILSDGNPVLLGMEVYPSFKNLSMGDSVVHMPEKDETPTGGHAICLMGYSLKYQQFLAKNSYGIDWGNNGYCWISFDYVTKHGWEKWHFQLSGTS